MRLIIFACAFLYSVSDCVPAGAWPKETECPLVHPEKPSLKFISASLDQHTDGPPWQPDRDVAEVLPDGAVHIITYYASYEIFRNAILICSYNEISGRKIVDVETGRDLSIPLPGILMRCEGIKHEKHGLEPDDWVRRWCTHDPEK